MLHLCVRPICYDWSISQGRGRRLEAREATGTGGRVATSPGGGEGLWGGRERTMATILGVCVCVCVCVCVHAHSGGERPVMLGPLPAHVAMPRTTSAHLHL